MATVPLSGTNIRFLSGVPFSNDYKHTRWFDTQTDQTNYFLSKTVVHSMSEANFQRIEGFTYIAANASIDSLWGTNYIMFQNESYSAKWFYAFVTKLEYKNRGLTYVHFEIDVFQTWKFDMDFKPSYVVREHCPLWNADGTPVVNTVDEGLNYGTEYDITGVHQYHPTNGVLFLVIVAKSTLHIPDGETTAGLIYTSINGGVQPLSMYIHPFDSLGQTPPVNVNGSTIVLPTIQEILNAIYTDTSAVNNVVSLYITDHIGIDCTYDSGLLTINNNVYQEMQAVSVGSKVTIWVKNSYSYSTSEIDVQKKYLDFGGVYGTTLSFSDIEESKLLMYPYSLSILDDFKGNRVVVKNEYVDGDSLIIDVMGSLGVSNKVAYIPRNYLTDNLTSPVDKTSVGLDKAMIDQTPHDVPIITDLLSAYLQGNKNTMMNQLNTIAFNGVMDVAGSGVGAVASAMTGNVLGIVGSGVNAVKGAGNAVLQMQGLQAKIKDINNQPPQLAKMGSNTAFEYGNGYYGFWLISKQIKPEYMKKLSDFFKTYGYKVNEVKLPNFHTRENWNYVQTNSCVILGNFNNEDLQELKKVFDNGITLWHTDDVGNYSLSNGVIA